VRIFGTCLVFISSEQSTEKPIFLDALHNLTVRFGRKITKPQEELFGNFTNFMEYNILLAIDDSKSEALRDNYEEQKNLITSDQSCVRELYIPDRQVITNARFIIVSNNPQVLRLEEGSRRFAVFEPSDKLQGEVYFFEKFATYWSDMGNRKATLLYFLDHKIPTGWHPEQSYPRTSMKKQIEYANLSMTAIYSTL